MILITDLEVNLLTKVVTGFPLTDEEVQGAWRELAVKLIDANAEHALVSQSFPFIPNKKEQ